jgi:hypothetical protein
MRVSNMVVWQYFFEWLFYSPLDVIYGTLYVTPPSSFLQTRFLKFLYKSRQAVDTVVGYAYCPNVRVFGMVKKKPVLGVYLARHKASYTIKVSVITVGRVNHTFWRICKSRNTLHNFYLKLSHATCLQLELYCVNQAHNSPATT